MDIYYINTLLYHKLKSIFFKYKAQSNPEAELFQISKALNINVSEILSIINYNDAMNGNNGLNINRSESGLNTVGKIYSYEKEEERRLARNSSSKLVSDLERFRRS